MSAWIVMGDHLDLLLTSALEWGLTDAADADGTGRMLWRENLTSVAYRYPNDRDGDWPSPSGFRAGDVDSYQFRRYPGRVDPQVVAIAADSLAYQSCEHPGWAASTACRWVVQLREQAAARIEPYIAEHGPVDPDRQPAGECRWSVVVDSDGNQHVLSVDSWTVPDRAVFIRAAALRTAAVPSTTDTAMPSDEPPETG